MLEPAKRPLRTRAPEAFPRPRPLRADEYENPSVVTILKLIWNTVAGLFREPIGVVIALTFVVLMLWGYHGEVELLKWIWPAWHGPGSPVEGRPQLLPGIPWDQELISFVIGFFLLVVIPALWIRLAQRQSLSDYGLGWAPRGRGKLACLGALLLGVASLPAFLLATSDAGMAQTYPLYRGAFHGVGDFALYEVSYLLFFVAIEFIFRGYLLFGLFHGADPHPGPAADAPDHRLRLGTMAILVSMLSYTAWHLGKPVPELFGTLVWGLAAGALVLATRTIWPVVLVHWLLNVFSDSRLATWS